MNFCACAAPPWRLEGFTDQKFGVLTFGGLGRWRGEQPCWPDHLRARRRGPLYPVCTAAVVMAGNCVLLRRAGAGCFWGVALAMNARRRRYLPPSARPSARAARPCPPPATTLGALRDALIARGGPYASSAARGLGRAHGASTRCSATKPRAAHRWREWPFFLRSRGG